jgi:ADP-dependent NAD(P)H-hydrate dehydratase / NAD(P)H-hydrate epimerase
VEGYKVISSGEMARVEKKSIEAGQSGEAYMDTAGQRIADVVERYVDGKEITLVIGKGNNGGDAFVAGCHLKKHGFTVYAVCLFPIGECSELCTLHWKRFEAMGGKVCDELRFRGVILDGILGTGFQGVAKGVIKEAVAAVNASECQTISIDIPSGLNGNTGEGEAVQADLTIFLGMPKVGFFLGKGFNYVGKLVGVSFGLPEKYVDELEAIGYLIDERCLSLPKVERVRHKYETGYVVALAGSPGMGGAAELSTLAALRGGAGIVRLFHPPEMEEELSGAFVELIRSPFMPEDTGKLFEEVARAKSLLIGPGLGKKVPVEVIAKLLKTGVPAVVDADGLVALQDEMECGEVVLTPHKMEFVRLLGKEPASLVDAAREFADKRGVTLVLKGAPTWIFHPGKLPLLCVRGDPGMATAGTGDVLTGIIAALLAQGMPGREAAVLGVYLHAVAGEEAARSLSSYSVIASDLIEFLPDVMASLE